MKSKIKKSLKAKFLGEYTHTSNRERSIIVLVIGFTIIISLLIFIRININNSNNSTQKEPVNNTEKVEEEHLSLDKIFNNYLDNYKYFINIIDSDKNIIYDGSISNKVDNGKRIINHDEIDYHIVNNIAIDLNTNKEITDLYLSYLSYFFTPSNIYEFIKDKECNKEIVDNNIIYIYNNIYNDGIIMFRIRTSKDRIEEINYSYNSVNYSIKLN